MFLDLDYQFFNIFTDVDIIGEDLNNFKIVNYEKIKYTGLKFINDFKLDFTYFLIRFDKVYHIDESSYDIDDRYYDTNYKFYSIVTNLIKLEYGLVFESTNKQNKLFDYLKILKRYHS